MFLSFLTLLGIIGSSYHPPAGFMSATGGVVTTSGNYKIHTFTTYGNTNFVVTSPGSVWYLFVGEGGSYYAAPGGGGGGGGVVTNGTYNFAMAAGTYVVGVSPGQAGLSLYPSNMAGYGGAGGNGGAQGDISYTAAGTENGGAGGSLNGSGGGGGSQFSGLMDRFGDEGAYQDPYGPSNGGGGPASGTGFAGGGGNNTFGGGGGGATGAGSSVNGLGGPGFTSSISGTAQVYSTGGSASGSSPASVYGGGAGIDRGPQQAVVIIRYKYQ